MNAADVAEEHRNGDCYVVALRFVLDHGQDFKLCHGSVIGTGPVEGIPFGHAWVEINDMVIDQANGNSMMLPKDIYYQAGNVKDVARYTISEARRMMIQHETYGPWA